jgi:hypothetical protein
MLGTGATPSAIGILCCGSLSMYRHQFDAYDQEALEALDAALDAAYFDSEGALLEAPIADASRRDLGLLASQVTSYDREFQGPAGQRFVALVRSVAKAVGLPPGLVAVNLIAETRRDSYLSAGRVSSFEVGTDDYYAKRQHIAARVPAHARVRWEAGVRQDVNEVNRTVYSISFISGAHAALASGVYLKHGEVVLREEAKRLKGDFDRLPTEVRLMLIRFAFNAGHGAARAELAKALKGQDVLIRKAAKKAGPRRIATLRAAQAMYLERKIFGGP